MAALDLGAVVAVRCVVDGFLYAIADFTQRLLKRLRRAIDAGEIFIHLAPGALQRTIAHPVVTHHAEETDGENDDDEDDRPRGKVFRDKQLSHAYLDVTAMLSLVWEGLQHMQSQIDELKASVTVRVQTPLL
mgnify:CR=1 FL=1